MKLLKEAGKDKRSSLRKNGLTLMSPVGRFILAVDPLGCIKAVLKKNLKLWYFDQGRLKEYGLYF